MGIRDWFTKKEKQEDDAEIRRVEDEKRSESPEERELIAGDIEGVAADRAAGLREESPSDIDRLAE